jgi:hypothetical protein
MRGQGIKLYEKMLDFLQDYANENKVYVLHVSKKVSDLDEEKWQGVFRPVLEPRDYTEIKDKSATSDRWKKMYKPE